VVSRIFRNVVLCLFLTSTCFCEKTQDVVGLIEVGLICILVDAGPRNTIPLRFAACAAERILQTRFSTTG
jgi:hypothetical protein